MPIRKILLGEMNMSGSLQFASFHVSYFFLFLYSSCLSTCCNYNVSMMQHSCKVCVKPISILVRSATGQL